MKKINLMNGTKRKRSSILLVESFTLKKVRFWWTAIGMNIGEEVHGKGENFTRPVIILAKLSKNLCIAIPTTCACRNIN